MLVRAVNTTTYGLRRKKKVATRCTIPRGRPTRTSSSLSIPQAASANMSPSHSRWTTHGASPIECRAA